jgi:hypothetical protein
LSLKIGKSIDDNEANLPAFDHRRYNARSNSGLASGNLQMIDPIFLSYIFLLAKPEQEDVGQEDKTDDFSGLPPINEVVCGRRG